MIRRILYVLAVLGWGFCAFVIALYTTFPAEAARSRAVYEFGEATNNEYAVDIDDLGLWRFSGVDLDGVQLYTVKKGRRTKDEPKPPMERTPLLKFDKLGVRVALLPTLFGKQAVAFDAGIYEGSIAGIYARGDESLDLSFEASDIDLSQVPGEWDVAKLVLLGKLEGEADLSLDTEDVKSSSGTLRLALPGLGLGAGSAVGGFQLPEVSFDKAVVAFEVRDGKLEVTEGTFESSLLTATLSGDITLNKKLARSRNRLDLTFTLPEDLDELAQLAPDLKRARDSEGKYHYLITGTVLNPNARGSRSGTRAPKIGGDAGKDPPIGADRDFDPEMDEDERKRAREKRIEERRERLKKRREEREAERAARPEGGDDEPADEKGPFMDPGIEPPDMMDEEPPSPEDFPMPDTPMFDEPPPPEEE